MISQLFSLRVGLAFVVFLTALAAILIGVAEKYESLSGPADIT
jgi:hypothetical protein